MSPEPATVTLLTPRGRSAVAVVSVHGTPGLFDDEPPLFRAANGRLLAEQDVDRVCFGRWGGETGEEVVVCRVEAERFEISCHGGLAAVARIVRDLETRGGRTKTWQVALRDQHSPIAAECLDALTRAPTLRTAGIILEQSAGLLERAFSDMLALDVATLVSRLEELVRWSCFGRHLTAPWQVVLTGLSNVGKSSMINRLVGYERSIVYAEPGTTRDVVTAAAVFDGWPVELSDTAGLRDAAGAIEAAGISLARRQLAGADLALIVVDRSRPIEPEVWRLIDELPRAIVVEHKCDLERVWTGECPRAALPVSSVTGAGLDRLIEAIVSELVPSAPPPGTAIPVTQRQIDGLEAARDAVVRGDLDAARSHVQVLVGGTQ